MRRIVVAGGRGYVGSAVCEAFLADDAIVVSLDRVAGSTDVFSATDGLVEMRCDLSSGNVVRSTMSEIARHVGGIDVVVCTAGFMSPDDGRGLDPSEPHWQRTFASNVAATTNVVECSLPFLRLAEHPAIVVVGSLVASLGSTTAEFAYTATKGAVGALAREMAVVFARDGIRVNVVAPGPLNGGLFSVIGREGEAARLARIPLGRRGSAEEVAAAVRFLASPAASYITGVTLMVDGGASAAFLTSET